MSTKNSVSCAFNYKLLNILEHDYSLNSLQYLEIILPKNSCNFLYYDCRSDNLDSIWYKLLLQFRPFAPQIITRMLSRYFPRDILEITNTIKFILQLNWHKRTYIILDNAHLLFHNNSNLIDFFYFLLKENLPNLHILLITNSNHPILDLNKVKTHPKTSLFKPFSSQFSLKSPSTSLLNNLTKPEYNFCLEVCSLDSFSFKDALFISSLGSPDKYIKRLLLLDILLYNPFNNTYTFSNNILDELRQRFSQLDSKTQKSIYLKLGKCSIQNGDYHIAANFYYIIKAKEELFTCLHLASPKDFFKFNSQNLTMYFSFLTYFASIKALALNLVYARYLLQQLQIQDFKELIKNIEPQIKKLKRLKIRRKLLSKLLNLKILADFPNITNQKKSLFKLQYLQQYQLEKWENWYWSIPEVISSLLNPLHLSFAFHLDNLKNCFNYYNNFNSNYFIGLDLLLVAEQNYYQNNLSMSLSNSYKALTLADSNSNISLKLMIYFLISKITIAQGDNQHFSLIQEKILALRSLQVNSALEHIFAFIDLGLNNLLKGKNSFIENWLEAPQLLNSNIYPVCKSYFLTQYLFYLLRKSDFKTLINTYQESENSLTNNTSPILNIYNYLFLAIAYNQLAEFSRSNNFFRKSLDLAVKAEIIMPFIENFSYLEHFLQKVKAEKISDFAYQNFLEKVTPNYKSNANKIFLSQPPPDLTILTSREKEIALLTASGLSNSDIANQLFIAEITVKKALQNIFRKLQVQNRLSLALLLKKTNPNS